VVPTNAGSPVVHAGPHGLAAGNRESPAAPDPVSPFLPPASSPVATVSVVGQQVPAPVSQPVGQWGGIPTTVLAAYQSAERLMAQHQPNCQLRWWMVAGIGEVESGHAHGGAVDANGATLAPILGPRLDGTHGFAAIPDTDHGALDGDPAWDRAVGPMQFIPSTWREYAVDTRGTGVADPNNVFDAAATTGRYLCNGGRDLRDPAQLIGAVYSYNPSAAYVRTVLAWMRVYSAGATAIPDSTTVPAGSQGSAPSLVAAIAPAPAARPSPSSTPIALPPATSAPSPAPTPSPTPAPPSTGGTTPTPTPVAPPVNLQCLLDLNVLGIQLPLLGQPPASGCTH
jgi:hypothetical protein